MQEQTEAQASVLSPKALSNFQTAEPVVSRAQKLQDCLEQAELVNSGRKPPSMAHSPEFYSSKVNFTQAYGVHGHPITDVARNPHQKTQKLSSLFNRPHNDANLSGLPNSQSSKGLSFNQYMQRQQEQAL